MDDYEDENLDDSLEEEYEEDSLDEDEDESLEENELDDSEYETNDVSTNVDSGNSFSYNQNPLDRLNNFKQDINNIKERLNNKNVIDNNKHVNKDTGVNKKNDLDNDKNKLDKKDGLDEKDKLKDKAKDAAADKTKDAATDKAKEGVTDKAKDAAADKAKDAAADKAKEKVAEKAATEAAGKAAASKVGMAAKIKVLLWAILIMFIVLIIAAVIVAIIYSIISIFSGEDTGESSVTETTAYNELSQVEYYWPIGSEETTEENGIIYAKGKPISTTITSNYGYRIHPVSGKRKMHNGVDIGGLGGYGNANVIAAKSGVVVKVVTGCTSGGNKSCGNGLGNYIQISHADGKYTVYAHLHQNTITVKKNDRVYTGEVIAKAGSSGNSTGTHLHFEVRTNATTRTNPLDFIDANNTRPSTFNYSTNY